MIAEHFISHGACIWNGWLWQTARCRTVPTALTRGCLLCGGPNPWQTPPLSHTGLLNLAELGKQTRPVRPSIRRSGSVSTISAVQRDFIRRHRHPPTTTPPPTPNPSSPRLLPNSTPLDVCGAHLVLDHKALDHCVPIKH